VEPQNSAPKTSAPSANPSKPLVSANSVRRSYPETFQRVRRPASPEELKRDLEPVPEILLESTPGNEAALISAHAREHPGSWKEPARLPRIVQRLIEGLPLRNDSECYLFDIPAKSLETLSERLHQYLTEAESTQGIGLTIGAIRGVDHLAARLSQDGDAVWRVPEAVPTLVQILQAQEMPYRRLLVQYLTGIRGEGATEALARRAVFDLSATVREEAVYALRNRPLEDYRAILVDGLRYPWAPATEFAAEALVNLNQTSALPTLVTVLSELKSTDSGSNVATVESGGRVRELVRINHVQNCLLCHAASVKSTDFVRAIVPNPDLPPPRSRKVAPPYYGGSSGVFARADVTYLKQDFSVVHTVSNPGKRSPLQRFDYLVRTRFATSGEREIEPHRRSVHARIDAIIFALRELTGEDHGRNAKAWTHWLTQETKTAGPLAAVGR
jgi:hypothetical protein